MRKSFTLIEIIITLGIIAVLSGTLIMVMNPSEAQKKSRDLKRMKDSQEISAVLEQFTLDRRTATGCLTSEYGCQSCLDDGTNPYTNSCTSNWLQEDLCQYTQKVPIDPMNCKDIRFIGGSTSDPQYFTTMATYATKISGPNYKVESMVEAKANVENASEDKGVNTNIAEFGNNLSIYTNLDNTLTGDLTN